jgi:hypothetical protein
VPLRRAPGVEAAALVLDGQLGLATGLPQAHRHLLRVGVASWVGQGFLGDTEERVLRRWSQARLVLSSVSQKR